MRLNDPEIFSARPVASVAVSNKEGAPSNPFGRWDLATMIASQGSGKKAERRAGCVEASES